MPPELGYYITDATLQLAQVKALSRESAPFGLFVRA